MDLVSAAIAAAAAAGLAGGMGTLGNSLATDAYQRLKNMLRRKHGEDSEVARAVDELEARPESVARRQVLAEEVEASGADKDPELVTAAKTLLERLGATPIGGSHIQQAVGSYIAQADRAGHAKVHVDRPTGAPRE